MPGEPEHAAAEAPMARAARHDDGVELLLAHLAPQRLIAPLIFGFGELLPHAIAVVRRVAHIGEGQRLIELGADDIPRLRTDARRADLGIHDVSSEISNYR